MRIRVSPLLLVPPLLAGCTASLIDAPSLAPRVTERQTIPLPDEAATEPTVPVDPALTARIAPIVTSADDGHARFEAERAKAAAAVARAAGAAQGSEPWIAAQQAVTALDAARGPVLEAAAALDTLRQDPANATSGNRAAIDTAAARIDALATGDAAAAAELAAKLG